MRMGVWVSKCVHLHTGISHETWAHPYFFPLSCRDKNGGVGGGVSAGGCSSVSRAEVVCRSGHLEPLSWIYCVGGGRGQVALLLPHEDFVSVGHRADAGSTDGPLSPSLRRTPQGSKVPCWGWRHDPNTDWLFSSPYQGRGSSLSPPLEMVNKWIWHKESGNTFRHNLFDSAAPLYSFRRSVFSLCLKQDTRPHVSP